MCVWLIPTKTNCSCLKPSSGESFNRQRDSIRQAVGETTDSTRLGDLVASSLAARIASNHSEIAYVAVKCLSTGEVKVFKLLYLPFGALAAGARSFCHVDNNEAACASQKLWLNLVLPARLARR